MRYLEKDPFIREVSLIEYVINNFKCMLIAFIRQ